MRWGDEERAIAHLIAICADDLGLVSWVVGNASAILLVPGEAEQDNALNLRNNCSIELLDRVTHHSGALAVATSNDLGVRALGVGEVEEGGGGADGLGGGALGQEVFDEAGVVWGANALTGDLGGTEEGLKGGADLGTNDEALFFVNTCSLPFVWWDG